MTRWYGTAVALAALRGQRRIPYLDRQATDALRDRRIRHIVRHAARTVPFYRDLFRRERIDPRDIRQARDLDALPLVDRQLVRQEPKLFRSTSRRAAGAIALRSSGSTGTPFEVLHDRRSLLANIGYGERERAVVIQLAGGQFRPRELYLGFETSNFRQVLDFYAASTRLPRPKRTTVSMVAPFEEIVAAINRVEPDVIVGYGGFLDDLLRTVELRGVRLHRPRVVMYVGERLPADRRDWIEKEFGARVLSRYCAVEALKIGYFCEARSGFHLHEDLCHVRIVDAQGRDVADGESGEVVVSSLVNHATVLLNYPMGDVASRSTALCACGRTQRMLSELEGRVEDRLRLSGGRSLHPRAIWAVFKPERQVVQYQVVQHELTRFEVRIVPGDVATFAETSARVRNALAPLLGPDARIDVAQFPALGVEERRANGKFRAVESRVRAGAGSGLDS